MNKFELIASIIIGILDILILIWWRCSCEWVDRKNKFPTRGHVLLLSIVAACPIANLVLFPVLIGIYLGLRFSDEIKLKKNKFNKYWFDIE